MINWGMIISLLVGLVIFLFGMQNFSAEIQKIAGEKFRKVLGKAVSNRFTATLSGAGVTALLQSSTATTLITVGLINAGVISFAQSLGIILGSNIGSTLTAQLVALNLTSFAPFLVIFGFFLGIFGGRYKYLGKGIFYFGLVFFGIGLISQAVYPIRDDPLVLDYFSRLDNTYLAILAGFIFTVLTNSSAVTIGIAIVLSQSGLISLQQGIPILLGANLGTTILTLIVSSRLNLYAKRTAVAHLMFNVIGVLILLPFITPFANFITLLGGSTQQQIANAHTIFNVLAAFLFLIILTPFRKVVEFLVPGNEEEILLKTKYLESKTPQSNNQAFEQIEKEMNYLLDISYEMFEISFNLLKEQKDKDLQKLEKLGTLSNLLSSEIEEALYNISQRKLTETEAKKVLYLVRLSNSLEQLGDIAEDIGNLPNSLIEKGIRFSHQSLKGIEIISNKFEDSFKEVKKIFLKNSSEKVKKKFGRSEIEPIINKLYESHIKILKLEATYSGSLFVESISLIENSISKLREVVNLSNIYSNIKKNKKV